VGLVSQPDGKAAHVGKNPQAASGGPEGEFDPEHLALAKFNVGSGGMRRGGGFQAEAAGSEAAEGEVAFLGGADGEAVEGEVSFLADGEALDLNGQEGGAPKGGRMMLVGIGFKSRAGSETKSFQMGAEDREGGRVGAELALLEAGEGLLPLMPGLVQATALGLGFRLGQEHVFVAEELPAADGAGGFPGAGVLANGAAGFRMLGHKQTSCLLLAFRSISTGALSRFGSSAPCAFAPTFYRYDRPLR
jgi:hypothetical protein